jgi:uncharacterized protein (DUF302 family)
MIRNLTLSAALALAAVPAMADIVRVEATGDLMEVMHELELAVSEAGATIFARVPHSEGAKSVDMQLNDAELLIFGNPQLGTPALQQDILAGLVLPLRMLVYTDNDGQTWIAYEEVEDMFEDFDIDDDSEFVEKMETALANFARAAAD